MPSKAGGAALTRGKLAKCIINKIQWHTLFK
jgi:hypothetical protein